MAKINSRSKGKRGERMACAFFEEWTGKNFTTIPASGGLRWKNTNTITGDIIADEPNYIFPFSIEAKNMAELNFQHLIYNVDSTIIDFWRQCWADGKRGKKVPLLLMRYNGLKGGMFFVVMHKNFYDMLSEAGFMLRPRLIYNTSLVISNTNELKKIPFKKAEKLAYKFLNIR